MKLRFTIPILFALLPRLAGGRSADLNPPSYAPVPGKSAPRVLGAQAFTTVPLTNQIQPEWLKPPPDLFTLGPGDRVEIEVLGETGSRSVVLVGPDGKIYYNILPGLFVWGRTLSEARVLVETELGKLMRVQPEVAVILKGVESKRVWLLGSVQKPGVYSLATPVTILEAISAAGGAIRPPGSLEGVPDLRRSFLLREGQMLRVDFHRLLSQGDLTQNLYLRPEDLVYLQSDTSRNVYVLGAVAAPSVVPWSDRLSLAAAIANCRGTLPYAQLSHVAIIRGSLANPQIAVVDFSAIQKGKSSDVALQEGDIVYLPFVPYRKLAVLLEGALSQFVYAVGYNYGTRIGGGFAVGPTVPGFAPAIVPYTPAR